MTTRFPLRIEPLPGEWWRSYLQRVAARYRVHPFAVLERVYGIDRPERRHLRWSGIVMSDAAVAHSARVVNLAPDEIRAMHLKLLDGSALDFTGRDLDEFNPAASLSATRLHLRHVGPLVHAATDRVCPSCVEGSPLYRATSWRLQVHLVCTRHRLPLSHHLEAAADTEIDDEVCAAQQTVLDRLSPTAENAAFFKDLYAQLGPYLKRPAPSLDQALTVSTEPTLESFREAVHRALAYGYPHYQGFDGWPFARAASHLRPPHEVVIHDNRSVRCFPHLLPMHLFAPGLSDLLHRAQIRPARAIGAAGAAMCVGARSLSQSLELFPPGRRNTTARLVMTHLLNLEREGCAEQFWQLCASAALQLLKENVDYRQREQVCDRDQTYDVATSAEPSAYPRTVRTWLVDQWACTYTSSNVRPSVRDGSIEHFDRLYGPGMRAALNAHLRECAA